jgi:uncharacterized repeat protein (TIGR01451 family)
MAVFYNQATLTYRGGTVNSNIVSANLTEALSVNKIATLDSYAAGQRLTFSVGIVNSSTSPVTASVSDDLGAYQFGTATVYPLDYVTDSVALFINGVPAADPQVISESPLELSGITVPASSSAVVIYSADATAYAPPAPDGQIVNTVTVSGAGAPVTASSTVNASSGSILTIVKSVDPTSIVDEDPLTYTFVIQNLGSDSAGADDNVVVTDVFDPIVNITSVTLNGVPLSEGTGYTYNEATGEFSTVAGVITVPAATYEQDPLSGAYSVIPGSVTLTVSGTV